MYILKSVELICECKGTTRISYIFMRKLDVIVSILFCLFPFFEPPHSGSNTLLNKFTKYFSNIET